MCFNRDFFSGYNWLLYYGVVIGGFLRLIICYYRIEFICILAGVWCLGLFALFNSSGFVNLWVLFSCWVLLISGGSLLVWGLVISCITAQLSGLTFQSIL